MITFLGPRQEQMKWLLHWKKDIFACKWGHAVCACVCVSVRETETERQRHTETETKRQRARETERQRYLYNIKSILCVKI